MSCPFRKETERHCYAVVSLSPPRQQVSLSLPRQRSAGSARSRRCLWTDGRRWSAAPGGVGLEAGQHQPERELVAVLAAQRHRAVLAEACLQCDPRSVHRAASGMASRWVWRWGRWRHLGVVAAEHGHVSASEGQHAAFRNRLDRCEEEDERETAVRRSGRANSRVADTPTRRQRPDPRPHPRPCGPPRKYSPAGTPSSIGRAV